MRHKKPAPPLLQQNPKPPEPGDETEQEKTVRSIVTMTRVLEQALDPNFGVTPGQLCDLCEMYLALMHLKKVTNEFWMEHMHRATGMMALAKNIEAEARLVRVEGLPAEAKATISGAIELSMKEINELRGKLLDDVELLKQVPLPGTPIH